MGEKILDAMRYAVQYRRMEGVDGWYGFDPWHTMAAFDTKGAADAYFQKQVSRTWEYRLIEVPDESCP